MRGSRGDTLASSAQLLVLRENLAHPLIPAVTGPDETVTAVCYGPTPVAIGEIFVHLLHQLAGISEACAVDILAEARCHLGRALVQHKSAGSGNVKGSAGDQVAARRAGALFAQDSQIDLRRPDGAHVLLADDFVAANGVPQGGGARIRPLLAPDPQPDIWTLLPQGEQKTLLLRGPRPNERDVASELGRV